MYLALAIFTGVFVICTLMSLCKLTNWWIRFTDFPRVQFAVGLGLSILGQLIWLDLSQIKTWCLLLLAIISLAYQLWWILPYTRLASQKVKNAQHHDPQNKISIMTANVLTPNRNSKTLLTLVEQNEPDILVTLETDDWWQQQLDVLEQTYIYTIKCPLSNLYGMHVYSQLPLHDACIEFLVEGDKPSMHAAVELRGGRTVRVHFLHPAPPSPTENDRSLERDAELLVVGKSVAEYSSPVIVTGDLNDVAWSPTTRLFKKISGLLDPRIGRGMFNTFNAKHWYLRWPLDHVFHSHHFTVAKLLRLSPFGSDHFALYVELQLEDAKQENELDADEDDKQEVNEKTQEAGVTENDVPTPN